MEVKSGVAEVMLMRRAIANLARLHKSQSKDSHARELALAGAAAPDSVGTAAFAFGSGRIWAVFGSALLDMTKLRASILVLEAYRM